MLFGNAKEYFCASILDLHLVEARPSTWRERDYTVHKRKMKEYKLNVKTRSGIGRGPARRLRASGGIPGVIYSKKGSTPISIDAVEFRTLMRAKGDSAALVKISIDDKEPVLSMIKDFQRNAVSQKVVHVDVFEVDPTVVMTAAIPVRVKGEAVGVLTENGVLEVAHELTVRCLPKDLPLFIEVDVSELHAGHTIHIADLPEIKGVTFPTNQNSVVASCVAEDTSSVPEVAAEAVPAESAEGAAPETK